MPLPDRTIDMRYTQRLHAFSGTTTYRLTGSAIEWDNDKSGNGSFLLSDIRKVRAWYNPTRVVDNKYHLRVSGDNGRSLEITNLSYRGIGDFEANNDEYLDLVRALHRRLIEQNPEVSYSKGNTRGGYILNVLLSIWIFLMLAIAFWFVLNIGVPAIIVIKVAIILYFVPRLWRYMRRNQPARYDPGNLPTDAFPQLAATQT